MTFYEKLERRWGRYAITGLMKYITAMYVVGFLIQLFQPTLYYFYLDLDPEAILHGHIWRIFTFLFFYPSRDIVWAILGIYIYYSLGSVLEQVWGSFKYNFFFFMGAFLMLATSLLVYILTGFPLQLYPTYMTFSIFLAYALTFPDTVFLLFFIIPVQAKYLALAEAVIYLFLFLISGDPGTKTAILLAFLNVVLFYFLTTRRRRDSNIFRMKDFR